MEGGKGGGKEVEEEKEGWKGRLERDGGRRRGEGNGMLWGRKD